MGATIEATNRYHKSGIWYLDVCKSGQALRIPSERLTKNNRITRNNKDKGNSDSNGKGTSSRTHFGQNTHSTGVVQLFDRTIKP